MAKKQTTSHPYSHRSNAPYQTGIPPLVGAILSLTFFAALFGFATTNSIGYETFRKCHGNCVNGILHFLGMPLAVSGVFLIVRSVSDSPIFTRILQWLVTTRYLQLYRNFETSSHSPWIFYALYMSIFEGILYRKVYRNPLWSRRKYLWVGVLLIVTNVGALEVVGHGIFEQHHSYVLEFFNSVFHTPLYGVNSILTLVSPRPDHVCWY